MAPHSFLSSRGVKRKTEDEDILHIDVKYADGIDLDNFGPEGNRRTYQVIGWVGPDRVFCTKEVRGSPDPSWRVLHELRLDNATASNYNYLHLEVVRTGSRSDPGTSSGTVLVGRTQVPLPKEVDTLVGGRHGLVRPVGSGYVAEGHIMVCMKRERIVRQV